MQGGSMIGHKSTVMFWSFRLELKKWCTSFSGFPNFNTTSSLKLTAPRAFLAKNSGSGNGKSAKAQGCYSWKYFSARMHNGAMMYFSHLYIFLFLWIIFSMSLSYHQCQQSVFPLTWFDEVKESLINTICYPVNLFFLKFVSRKVACL